MTIDLNMARKLKQELTDRGVRFDSMGFPIFERSSFSEVEPENIAPWHHRRFYKDSSSTSLCFYIPDGCIYPRFERVFEETDWIKKFLSVVSMDLSVSKKMPLEVQRFIMLLNALYTASLACTGRKIIPSLRCGDETTIGFLLGYKGAPLMALGLHGCARSDLEAYDEYVFRSEILLLQPKKILVYGKPTKKDKTLLDDVGIPYRSYPDFRTLYGQRRPK